MAPLPPGQFIPSPVKRMVRACQYGLRRTGIPAGRDDLKLRRLKNCHNGKRAFILGNGPSLKVEYLERLHGEVTFAMNQMFRCFNQTSWRPNYYVLSDMLVAENYGTAILQKFDGQIFASKVLKGILGIHPQIIYYSKNHEVYEDEPPDFSDNVFYLNGGFTTAYLCFQLAWYMGVRDFMTLGIDASYSFSTAENHGKLDVYDKVANAPKNNWFIPGYFEKDAILLKPKVKQQILAYRSARRFIECHGGRIRNAGYQSPLNEFDRVDFNSLF